MTSLMCSIEQLLNTYTHAPAAVAFAVVVKVVAATVGTAVAAGDMQTQNVSVQMREASRLPSKAYRSNQIVHSIKGSESARAYPLTPAAVAFAVVVEVVTATVGGAVAARSRQG